MNKKLLFIILSAFILSCTYTRPQPENTQNSNDSNDTIDKPKSDTAKSKKTRADNRIYYTVK